MSAAEYRKTDTAKELNRFTPADGLTTLTEMFDYVDLFQCGCVYSVYHTLPVTIRGRPKTQVSNIRFVIHHPK